MTPNDLLDCLNAIPADAPLVFETEAGAITGGYHVTELKHRAITGIDCGGRIDAWLETALQLLDGDGGPHMPVGKFRAIQAQSIRQVPGLGESPMHVEFAPQNGGMRIWRISAPHLREGAAAILLSETRANCKPAMEAATMSDQPACCPTGTASGAERAARGSACCPNPS